MRTAVPLALAAAAAVLLSGCGSTGSASTGSTSAGSGGTGSASDADASDAPAATSPSGATELTIVVRTAPGQGKVSSSLRCDPPGGDHADPEAACRALEELEQPFAPVPADQACTEIWGGPQTARVTGTLRGEPVDATFNRSNGCEIERWDAHVAVLVEAGGADGT